MGYTTSTVHGIQVPDSAQANNVPAHLLWIVDVLEAGSVVKRLTSTQIAALTSGQKPLGLLVFNTTTGKLQQSYGSTFDNVDAAAIAAAASAATGLGFVDAQRTAHQLGALEGIDGAGLAVLISQFNKGEATLASGIPL